MLEMQTLNLCSWYTGPQYIILLHYKYVGQIYNNLLTLSLITVPNYKRVLVLEYSLSYSPSTPVVNYFAQHNSHLV